MAPSPLTEPAVIERLVNSIASPDCRILKILKASPQARAVVVISDNTRPVPHRDADPRPLLSPFRQGFTSEQILVLVATGTIDQYQEELESILIAGFGAGIELKP